MNRIVKAVAVALCGICYAGGASANNAVSLILDFVPSAGHSPYYYAQSQGWYKEAGIDLKIEVGRGSAFSSQSVGAGTVDFGVSDLATAFVAVGKGADIVSVMNIYGNSPQGFYWLKSNGINGPKDFAGRSIGNPPGDAARAIWPAFAKAVGVDPSSIKFVNIAPPAKVAALRSRSVDIISDFFNAHDLKVREFGDDLGFVAWRDVGVNLYGLSIMTRRQLLQSQPDLVKRFVNVTQRAFEACIKDVNPCLDALFASASGLDRKISDNEWERVKQLMRTPEAQQTAIGWLNPERVASDYQIISTYIGLDKPFDHKTAFTNEYLNTSVKMPK